MLPGSVYPASVVDVHEYTITVDYSISRLWVEAKFASKVSSITARSNSAGKYLIDARGCGEQSNIRLRNRRMMLPDDGITCINYTVDLARAAAHDREFRNVVPGNAIVPPSLWLWRPEITSRSEIRARFRLPTDVHVSVPWELLDERTHTYRLSQSPESANAVVMFGNFDASEIEVPGSVLRVGIANTGVEYDRDRILNWLRTTATDVSLTYGRFPHASPQIVVIPVPDGKDVGPVPFGRVIRDGGETVQLFVNPARPTDELMFDWTATHEFSHLMLPYLGQRHRWISEGFSQYYQNVLLARSGAYDELFAWQKIYDGLQRGRQSRPEMSPNEAAEGGVRDSLMKIYWSGAALALMADVELRQRSGGTESLDLVLGRLQECCLPANRVWTGIELFNKLDSLIETPVFMPLFRRYADTAGFPDTSEVFERLGLQVEDGKIRIRRHGELADVRTAIVYTDERAASQRKQLASANLR